MALGRYNEGIRCYDEIFKEQKKSKEKKTALGSKRARTGPPAPLPYMPLSPTLPPSPPMGGNKIRPVFSSSSSGSSFMGKFDRYDDNTPPHHQPHQSSSSFHPSQVLPLSASLGASTPGSSSMTSSASQRLSPLTCITNTSTPSTPVQHSMQTTPGPHSHHHSHHYSHHHSHPHSDRPSPSHRPMVPNPVVVKAYLARAEAVKEGTHEQEPQMTAAEAKR